MDVKTLFSYITFPFAWVFNNILLKLVGNKPSVAIGIFTFIAIFVILGVRCAHSAELDLIAGAGLITTPTTPVLGIDVVFPQGNNLDIVAGTMLWGSNPDAENNWDWSLGVRTCRWKLCGDLAAAYVQKVDALNGSHTNYNLRLSYEVNLWRWKSIMITHLSNAGTISPNKGRNALVFVFNLQ